MIIQISILFFLMQKRIVELLKMNRLGYNSSSLGNFSLYLSFHPIQTISFRSMSYLETNPVEN